MTKLMSVSEVARKLGRSVDWLREAEKRGKIPGRSVTQRMGGGYTHSKM